MPSLKVVETRGAQIDIDAERVYDVAVADASGDVLYRSGVDLSWRSCAKPLQGYDAIQRALDAGLELTEREIAVGVSSHPATEAHREEVRKLLAHAHLQVCDLQCGCHNDFLADDSSKERDATWGTCSGHHALALVGARFLGDEASRTYRKLGAPVQTSMWEAPVQDGILGVGAFELINQADGCGMTLVRSSLDTLASVFAQLGSAKTDALRVIRDAMQAHPELVGGIPGVHIDMQAMQVDASFVAKVGAGNTFCLANDNVGLAVKGRAGGFEPLDLALVTTAAFKLLGDSGDFMTMLESQWPDHAVIRNSHGVIVGERRVEFL